MAKIRVLFGVDLVVVKDKAGDNLFRKTESMEESGVVFETKVSAEDEEGLLVNFLVRLIHN